MEEFSKNMFPYRCIYWTNCSIRSELCGNLPLKSRNINKNI